MAVFTGAGLAAAWFSLPFPGHLLEDLPESPVVRDRSGEAYFQTLGNDGQWRIPVPLGRISPWLVQATVAVEDERFYAHPGVDPVAVARALRDNLLSGRRVSGASTLTMQLCRMLDDRPRTYPAKALESWRALQLERALSKAEIVEAYLNLAPYGGNLRGAEAAAQRYFGLPARDLSLAEAALLAGLPQSPSRLRPDRHLDRALKRRRHVLDRMVELGAITSAERESAEAAPLRLLARSLGPAPADPAYHHGLMALERRPAGGTSALDIGLQREVKRQVIRALANLPDRTEIAVVAIHIPTGEIRALIGSAHPDDPAHGQVNGTLAPRSPGSTLKPFVYASAFEAGRLAPGSIVYDVPIDRAGWRPENFDRSFAGPVTAGYALRESLNIPALLVARATGLNRWRGLVEAAGVPLPPTVTERAGLAAVVGAVEVRLIDVTNAYATLGRGGVHRPARLFPGGPEVADRVLDPGVCAALDDILGSHSRGPSGAPPRGAGRPWFMWKTGTSSGRRDAWAVGHNGRYAIGIWAGRFSGQPDPAFTGAGAAEPLLANLFDLPQTHRTAPPPPPPALPPVRRPLPPPPELAAALRITSPAEGAIYIATRAGRAEVFPRNNQDGEGHWFLNGSPLAAAANHSFVLAVDPGRHELRCVAADGAYHAVSFTVR